MAATQASKDIHRSTSIVIKRRFTCRTWLLRSTGINPEPFVAAIPGSKSLTNRALILAAQRLGTTRLIRALHCEDTDYLAACLNRFGGLSVAKTFDGYRIERTQPVLQAPPQELYVGAAGTPARFLLSFAAMAQGETTITGNPRLCERPMGDLLRAFDRIGIRYECLREPDRLPIRVCRSSIASKFWTVTGTTSSQFTSFPCFFLLPSSRTARLPWSSKASWSPAHTSR